MAQTESVLLRRPVASIYLESSLKTLKPTARNTSTVNHRRMETSLQRIGRKLIQIRCSLVPGCVTKKQSDGEQTAFAPHPNLALNIGIQNVDRKWIWIVAVFGTLLQCSMLGYAVWANFHAPFYKNETKPSVEFAVLTLVGTTFLVIGTAISARLVDGKSGEQSFVSDGQSLRFCWLQAGGQRIGDQVFDEFVYSENMKEYLTSRRTDEDKRNIIHAPYSAFFAMVLSLFGWIAQFIGLRGQHGTVALFQLLATLSMCIARGLLRGYRMSPKKNLLSDSLENIQGHELDWQALNLPVSPNHSERNRPGLPSSSLR